MTLPAETAPDESHLWALHYAYNQLRVLPIKPGEKRPPMAAWQNAATTDPAIVDAWWTELYRGHGVGIATGRGSGVFVLDVDVADGKAGDETLAELEATHGPLPDTWTAITGSGGTHYYFALPHGVEIRNDAGRRLGPGLDIRGEGGQVVAPPTMGRLQRYEWERDVDTPLADPPGWLLELLTATPEAPTPPPAQPVDDGDSVAARYNARTTWAELLGRDGWTLAATLPDGEQHWTRPGKEVREGISATTGHGGGGQLQVFTSSLPWLPEGAYSRFGYYACAEHSGDRSAAARALYEIDMAPVDALLDAVPVVETHDEPETVQWEQPIPLSSRSRELPTFPVDVFPYWIGDQVRAVATELQMPPDLPAVLALICIASLTAKTTRVKVRGTWHEPLNLYAAVAMPPSAGKSPAFSAMLGPVRAWETELVETLRTEYALANQAYRMAEKAMLKAEQSGDESQAAEAAVKFLALDPAPASPRVICDDVTPEALAVLLSEQKGKIAMLSTEGGVFDIMTGRYSERANLDVYLKAWGGDDITVDRVGRGNFIVEDPALTIGLTVQPSVIASLAEKPELAGRGLTARFMYSLPQDNVGNRNFIDQPEVDGAIRSLYDDKMAALARSVANMGNTSLLTVAGDASARFNEWRQAIEERRRPDGDMRPLAEWSTKLESSVLRVAGLLHLAFGGYLAGQIDLNTMDRAIAVGDYWIEHAFAVHDLWGTDPVLGKARTILEWAKGRDRFTVRDVYVNMRRTFRRADDTIAPLSLLVERGWIQPLEAEWPPRLGRRGVASPTLLVNPVHVAHDVHARTSERQNDPKQGSYDVHDVHVLRDVSEDLLTSYESTGSDTAPCAHGLHGHHDSETDPIDIDPMADLF